ncbi:hypothetical protein ACJZ2D_005825 [Fusarium nematophilum]
MAPFFQLQHSLFSIYDYCLPHMKTIATIANNASRHQRLHRPTGPAGLHLHTGCYHLFHSAPEQPVQGTGFRVDVVAPGPGRTLVALPYIYETNLMDSLDTSHLSGNEQRGLEAVYESDGTQPSEIAPFAVFLVSNDSSCASGQAIHRNGEVVVNG